METKDTIQGIRLTLEDGEFFVSSKFSRYTHQYKSDSMFKSKEAALKRIASLLDIKIEIKT